MGDPLAEVVRLLQPCVAFSKIVSAAGAWRVFRTEAGLPVYYVVLEGSCLLAVEGQEPVVLQEGDFVLMLSANRFTMSSLHPDLPEGLQTPAVALGDGEFRHGVQSGPPDVVLLGDLCNFDSPDAALMLSLLPQLVHVRGEPRLTTLVQLVREEARDSKPARDVVLERLLEVLFIEALRSMAGTRASSGLVRGLADPRLAGAIRRMHAEPARQWTVEQLAKEAALSRSAFFERFSQAVGLPPMEYLFAWRMTLARKMLRSDRLPASEVAERIGYGSASAFSVAFSRHAGVSPGRYSRNSAV